MLTLLTGSTHIGFTLLSTAKLVECSNASIDNYSLNAAFGMFILDIALYSGLAWYFDQILPASLR